MREARITKPYTTTEIADICRLYYEDNMTAKEVAEMTGRSLSAIKQVVMRNRDKYIEYDELLPTKPAEVVAPPSEPSKPAKMTPREMIKALYDMGYRIENNQLVCYVKQAVKIQDIING